MKPLSFLVNLTVKKEFCLRPLVFTFAVETDELIQSEEKKLREQIQNLQNISFSVRKEM
jgi:hypothetical protein